MADIKTNISFDEYNAIIDKATAKSDLEQAIKKYGDVKFSEDVASIVAEILGTKAEPVKVDSENKSKK